MTICVDRIAHYSFSGAKKHLSGYWCHLWSDTDNEEELHTFARKIGMERSWFQGDPRLPHYDLRPSMREKAIKNGAIEGSLFEHFKTRRERGKPE